MTDRRTGDETWIDQAASDFERAWRAGPRPRIEDSLEGIAEPRRSRLLKELVQVELELRLEAGEAPRYDEYLRRFPWDAALLLAVLEPALSGSRPADGPLGLDRGSALGALARPPASPPVPRPAGGGNFGDYQLLEKIDQGGMGVVFKACQISLNRIVAVKAMLSGQLASEEDVRRFHREAEAAANLDHPNIVPIFEVGRYKGRHFFSMAYVEGGSLAKRIADGPLPPREAAAMARRIAKAVHYAHEKGVIHRDLKPANIMLDRLDQPKITDFGLARKVEVDSSLTLTGQVMGTPSYMSPEQAAGKGLGNEIGPASDVYSLGAVLYCMLTGRPPFQASSVMETLRHVLERAPAPPRRLNPEVSRDLETICLKCLEKVPSRRYATAADLAADLKRWMNHETILARPVQPVERLGRWCQRNPRLVIALGTATAAMLTSIALASLYAHERVRAVERISGLSEGLETAQKKVEHLNRNLDEEGRKAAEALHKSRQLSVSLASTRNEANRRLSVDYLDRGLRQSEKGDVAAGLLWFARCLASSASTHDDDLQHAARANLAAWASEIHESRLLFEHPARVTAVILSPDGRIALTHHEQNPAAQLWEVATGRLIGRLLVNDADFHCAAFSPNGEIVLIGTDRGVAQLCEVATGRALADPWDHRAAVTAVAFHPSRKCALTADAMGVVRLWNTETGEALEAPVPVGEPKPIRRRPDRAETRPRWALITREAIFAAAFSPDGTSLLTGHPGNVARLWDVETARPRCELKGPQTKPANQIGTGCNWVTATAFSPDGKTVVTGSDGGTAYLWDMPENQPCQLRGNTMEHQGSITDVAFSPDGMRLLTGGRDGKARLWDVATGLPIGKPMEQQRSVLALAFQPDGQGAVIAGEEQASATGRSMMAASNWRIQRWDMTDSRPLRTLLTIPEGVVAAAFDSDGQTLRTIHCDAVVKTWDPTNGRDLESLKLKTDRTPLTYAAFSPDGKILLTGDGLGSNIALLWDVATGRPLSGPLRPELPYSLDPPTKMEAVRIGLDGKSTRAVSPIVVLWDEPGHWSIASFMPPAHGASDWLAAIRSPREIPVRLPFSCSRMINEFGVFSPDGNTLLTANQLWKTATGQPVGEAWNLPPGRGVAAFSPDGKVVLVSRFDDLAGRGTTQFWDVASGRSLGAPLEHHEAVLAAAFSPDHRLLLLSTTTFPPGDWTTVEIWDFAARRLIGHPKKMPRQWYSEYPVSRLRFSPDGKTILIRGHDRGPGTGSSIRLWRAPALVEGDVERVKLWIEVLTGMELDETGGTRTLSIEDRQDRRHRLERLGEPILQAPQWPRKENNQ